MNFAMENASEDFQRFWQLIGAEGDLEAALQEWTVPYNASSLHQELLPSWPPASPAKPCGLSRSYQPS
jgi:hypothetical protein